MHPFPRHCHRKHAFRTVLGAFVLAAVGATASADGILQKIITPADQSRLKQLDAVRREALADARAKASREDLAALEQALAGTPRPLDGTDLTGEWQCRSLKLGAAVPLAVYGWFRCRVSDDGSGFRLEKLDGSQRTAGRFYDAGPGRMTYLGVSTVAGQPPTAYGKDASRDQVALAVSPGKNRLRLEFPLPAHDSRFDIMDLQR